MLLRAGSTGCYCVRAPACCCCSSCCLRAPQHAGAGPDDREEVWLVARRHDLCFFFFCSICHLEEHKLCIFYIPVWNRRNHQTRPHNPSFYGLVH